jgi:hypothetical protein
MTYFVRLDATIVRQIVMGLGGLERHLFVIPIIVQDGLG